jgi:surface antigen
MRTFSRLVATSLVVIGLGACAGSGLEGIGPKEGVGTLVGAGTGALIGSQIGGGRGQLVATSLGTLLGGYLGNQAGRSLDRADQIYAGQAQLQSLEFAPSGAATSWRNPDTGNYGEVVPMPAYQGPSGAYCREFRHNVYIGGQKEPIYGTACRQPDGQWQLMH